MTGFVQQSRSEHKEAAKLWHGHSQAKFQLSAFLVGIGVKFRGNAQYTFDNSIAGDCLQRAGTSSPPQVARLEGSVATGCYIAHWTSPPRHGPAKTLGGSSLSFDTYRTSREFWRFDLARRRCGLHVRPPGPRPAPGGFGSGDGQGGGAAGRRKLIRRTDARECPVPRPEPLWPSARGRRRRYPRHRPLECGLHGGAPSSCRGQCR
jgi:hypothetical protein